MSSESGPLPYFVKTLDGEANSVACSAFRGERSPPLARSRAEDEPRWFLTIQQDVQVGPAQEARGPLAPIVANPILYGMVCAYAALAAGTRRNLGVVRDRDEAEAWLARRMSLWADWS